jgi:hypothetical protein
LHFGKTGWGTGLVAVLVAAIPLATPAHAALGDWALAPPSFAVGSAELRLNGAANGALFSPHQPGWRGAQASGAFLFMPQLRRDYDSGLSLALNGTFAAADDAAVSLDNPRTSFHRDPGTGRAVRALFPLRTQVSASSNYAKFVYTSPSLFGAQLALSFAPTEGKQLPFLDAGPDVPGRQATFWEAALRYETEFAGAGIAASAAVSESRGERKLPGQQGTSDFGFGLRVDYPLTEELTASLGGAWRQSNAYAFNVKQTWQPSITRAQHASAMLGDGVWRLGVEYGNGVAKEVGIAGLPRLGLNGWQASAGYRLSPSLNVSAGWQRLGSGRNDIRAVTKSPRCR